MENSLPLEYPSMSRRQLLNFLTGAVVATTVGAALYPPGKFLTPPAEGNGDGSPAMLLMVQSSEAPHHCP